MNTLEVLRKVLSANITEQQGIVGSALGGFEEMARVFFGEDAQVASVAQECRPNYYYLYSYCEELGEGLEADCVLLVDGCFVYLYGLEPQ